MACTFKFNTNGLYLEQIRVHKRVTATRVRTAENVRSQEVRDRRIAMQACSNGKGRANEDMSQHRDLHSLEVNMSSCVVDSTVGPRINHIFQARWLAIRFLNFGS